jgi:CheY-like chemotaxis protein
MTEHALSSDKTGTASGPTAVNLTPIAQRAGIVFPTWVSALLAKRYELTPDASITERHDLYDLVGAANWALAGRLGSQRRRVGRDEHICFEFWSLLGKAPDPVAIEVVAVLRNIDTGHITLHLCSPCEVSTAAVPRVLVVDEDVDVARCAGRLLQRRGFEVAVAHSGRDAMRMVVDEPPDLILMEVVLPDLNGFEVCRRLKADLLSSAIPVVFCAARCGLKVEAMAAGAVEYLEKPADLIGLAERLHQLLCKTPTANTAASRTKSK